MGEEYVFQHYVPEFYLRNFRDGENMIHCLHVDSNRRFKQNASDSSTIGIAASDYFYDESDEKILEQGLEEFEGSWSKSVQKLLAKGDIRAVSEEVKADFLIFLSVQYIRTRSTRQELLDAVGENEELLENLDMLKDFRDSGGRNTHLIMIRTVTELLSERLKEYGKFCLYKNYSQVPFITSDNPVVHYHHEKPEEYDHSSAIGVGGSDWELYFPLTPRHCLSVKCTVKFGENDKTIELENEEIPNIQNTLQLVQASEIAICGDSGYKGIQNIW